MSGCCSEDGGQESPWGEAEGKGEGGGPWETMRPGGEGESHSPSRQPPGRNGGIISHQPPAALSRRSAVYSIGPQRGHEARSIAGWPYRMEGRRHRLSHEEGEV
jgi:hypothetical protein